MMNIALVGYGRMGREIEEIAVKRGHNIRLIIDLENQHELVPEKLSDIDVVIEFTTPESAYENVMKCLAMKKPVVSGTTGWGNNLGKAVDQCLKSGTSFIHSTNFSLGVNILFRLNEELARTLKSYKEYSVAIEEIHHTKKLDAPSGTAISIAEGIVRSNENYDGWAFAGTESDKKIPVTSVREGSVPGTHTIVWDSENDRISLQHEAKGRKGLAFGAVLAAEFISRRKGVFTMSDVLGF